MYYILIQRENYNHSFLKVKLQNFNLKKTEFKTSEFGLMKIKKFDTGHDGRGKCGKVVELSTLLAKQNKNR